MAVNIKGGQQNVIHSKQNIPVEGTGITAQNTAIIYLIDDITVSYVPGRSINGFSDFVKDKGYLIQAVEDMQLDNFFYPPFAQGFVTEEGTTIIPE